MPDHASVSYWLETAGDDLTPRPSLDGTVEADVAILGAGLTGLWTAFYLHRRDPSRRIVIVEREIAGFGASGRNGAWCAPDLNISMSRLAKLHGEDAARRMQQATYDAVDEVGRATAEAGIDAGFHKGGEIIVSRGPQGVPALEESLAEYRRFGFGDRYRIIDAAELAERVRIAGAVTALVSDDAAVVHPGRLVRGLARAVERDGTTIYEGTPVTGFRGRDATGRAALVTPTGEVRAPVIVLAGEAYLTELAGAAPPARAAVVADRAHGAGHRRPVGRDRLGQPRDARVDPPLGRLPVAHGGRPDPVRRPRGAVPLRVADPPRVRPPRPDPRDAPGVRALVVPVARGHPVHARLGRSARDAAGLAPDDGVRSRRRASRRRAATWATACRRRTSRAAR